jgi:hypothetical protein
VCSGAHVPKLPSPLIRILACSVFAVSTQALTLEQIESSPNLTPERFASFFRSFNFQFHAEIQSSEIFLGTESGDCDDYAILASNVLRRHGYRPRLITIRMPEIVHVVCYIPETNSYLDYNLRAEGSGLVECRPEISEIARSVARSYGAKWSSASEFTFQDGSKRLVQTVVEGRERQFASTRH